MDIINLTPQISFMVACYNEENAIIQTLQTLQLAINKTGVDAEVIVIDDASTDQSVIKINEWIKSNPDFPIRLLLRDRNQGLAKNYIEGAVLSNGEYYRLVCGDNVEPQETIELVISSVGRADIVLFYQPDLTRLWYRKFLGHCYTQIINSITGHRIKYYNGLPLLKRRDVINHHTNSRGFGFQADLITKLLDEGLSYVEIPVKAVDRSGGHSKAINLSNLMCVCLTIHNIIKRRFCKILG